jgi:hypothetical protein
MSRHFSVALSEEFDFLNVDGDEKPRRYPGLDKVIFLTNVNGHIGYSLVEDFT